MSEAKLITCSCKKQYLPLIVKNHDLKSQNFCEASGGTTFFRAGTDRQLLARYLPDEHNIFDYIDLGLVFDMKHN